MDACFHCLGLRSGKKSSEKHLERGKSPATDIVKSNITPIHRPDEPSFKWKFVDANAFIHQGALKFVQVENLQSLDFVAISYTWSKNMLLWRKWILSLGPSQKASQPPSDNDASEDMKAFHQFFTVVCFLVLARSKSLFWIDVLSIDQDSSAEKAFFVPKMGSLYAAASETHAYATGSNFVAMSSKELYFPVWETRAWTLQEYVLSNTVIYCYCFAGDVMRDIKLLKKQNSARLPSPITELRTPTLVRYRSSIHDNTFVLETRDGKMTCCFDEDTWMGPELTVSSYLTNEMFGPDMNLVIGRSTLSKIIYSMKQNPSRTKLISTALTILGGRKSMYPEDMMYSVLGILEMADFKVRYNIGFDEAKMAVFEGMKPDILAIVLGTDWGCLLDAKNNDSALPRVIGSQPVLGIERMEVTNSARYTREIGTTITSRKERFRLWKDPSRSQSRSTGTVRAMLGSQESRLMVMFCASLFDDPAYANIPLSDIPDENIRPVVVSGESRLSDDDYFNKEVVYDKEVELVELGVCTHHALFPDPGDEKYMRNTALLALECEKLSDRLTEPIVTPT
ncbi:hypothetical protein JR316_0003119 [Psilocybe cubensis]|uniref:Uncharacterized protein n=1 Tax=Psilocybe cubensis TaxID=181762 RepID=A0ACB8H8Y0_PSICU|nr:hypothetical protein JR316_0003119 [Psilocybe cubensis]KAH9483649.1 hypothetical protein JR316_0003119 [Psilocybe cubensis]